MYNLAILRTAAGGTQEAISLYRQVIEAAPDNAAAHLNLGLLLQQAGKAKEATEQLNLAITLDPSLSSRLEQPALPPVTTSPTPSA
jgi:tetratricopeptide (TPR) repeat protein